MSAAAPGGTIRRKEPPVFDRILFAKIGWAPNYEGENCTGNLGEPNKTDSWYERFNFLPGHRRTLDVI
jgi:hypothetical protein